MNIRKKRFSLLIAFLSITTVIIAQQVGSNSPYSRYGYGLLMNPVPSASEAMGGISYGLRRSQQVNWVNPASYSKLDTLTFIFDLGISGHMARMSDGVSDTRDFYNGNLDYVAIQFPLFRKIGASIGLLPYSKMGYNFGDVRSVSNTQYYETYRGTGGLNQIYGGIAWEPIQNISIGANFSYLFGNFSRSSVVVPASGLVGETKYGYSLREFKYDLGMQFTYPIDKVRSVTFGAVYSPRLNARADVNPTEMLYTSDPYNTPGLTPSQVLKTDTLTNASFQLPHTFGAGVTYSTGRFLVGLDGTYQLWKDLEYPDVLDNLSQKNRFNNAFRVNAGMEYVIDPMSQNYFHRVRFRGGLSYSNSYTNFSVNDPNDPVNGAGKYTGTFKEYGVNVGLGLPFRDYMSGHVSMLNIGFGYTRQQPDRDYMIKQDMFKITIGVNINELWFFKRQFN
ncbi:MAG: hypothetical protein VB074_13090 [Proteiniphilum sp.]|uniref:hypothetical protein n=1 Tax=Proteiniphilum sp. TaxID=1926877 RepID=UPI002B1EF9D8|nr:hypothetical protein [Proteiniphilum sp.]MEA5129110.1 hypothetical protein [Proteiniphilum sp.]